MCPRQGPLNRESAHGSSRRNARPSSAEIIWTGGSDQSLTKDKIRCGTESLPISQRSATIVRSGLSTFVASIGNILDEGIRQLLPTRS